MRDAAKTKTNFWTIANSIKRYLTIIHRCRYEAVRLKSYKMKRCRKTRIKPLACLHFRVSFTRILKKSSYFKPGTCPWRAVPAASANHIDGTEGLRYVLVCSCEVHVFRRDITKDKTRIILKCKFNHNLQSGAHCFAETIKGKPDRRLLWPIDEKYTAHKFLSTIVLLNRPGRVTTGSASLSRKSDDCVRETDFWQLFHWHLNLCQILPALVTA